jgi:dephospho-CoA kinase
MARLVVAVTGGIASGKSLVDRAFAALGVPVVDADLIAREIVEPGQPALTDIAREFGATALTPEGGLDRVAMRARVFGDPGERRKLEAITHPRIRALMLARCRAAPDPYVIASIPLLAEAGAIEAYAWLHRVLVVDAPVAAQRQRLLRRDGIDATLADSIIGSQASRARRLSLATDVIVNDASPGAVEAPVRRLHARFVGFASIAGLA